MLLVLQKLFNQQHICNFLQIPLAAGFHQQSICIHPIIHIIVRIFQSKMVYGICARGFIYTCTVIQKRRQTIIVVSDKYTPIVVFHRFVSLFLREEFIYQNGMAPGNHQLVEHLRMQTFIQLVFDAICRGFMHNLSLFPIISIGKKPCSAVSIRSPFLKSCMGRYPSFVRMWVPSLKQTTFEGAEGAAKGNKAKVPTLLFVTVLALVPLNPEAISKSVVSAVAVGKVFET